MKKHLTSIIIVSIICIVSGLGAFLLSGKTSEFREEIATLQQEVQGLEIQASRLGAEKQAGDAEAIDLSRYFIAPDGALGFVEYIESVAVSSGLSYKINLFDAEQNADLAKQDRELLKTSLTTTGSLKNTRDFISLIETLPYNVRINKIDLKRGGDGAGAANPKDVWTLVIDFSAVKIIEKI